MLSMLGIDDRCGVLDDIESISYSDPSLGVTFDWRWALSQLALTPLTSYARIAEVFKVLHGLSPQPAKMRLA